MASRKEPVAVIGLGRFGTALALELARGGTEVLAVDSRPDIVQRLSGQLGQIVVADSTDPDVEVGRRRVPGSNQRHALAIALLGIGLVAVATFLMEAVSDFSLDQVLFEVISAFATVGLSTGITADLPTAAQVLLVLLMYVGRIGPLTLASGLALRERARRHQLPEERTIVG